MALLTQKAYARHRKVTPQYVNKLVRQGRIPVNRAGLINSKRADAMLNATRRVGRVITRARKRGGSPAPPPRGRSRPSDTQTLTGWRAQTEEYKAKAAKLEYEKALGQLLPRDQVLEAERRKNANIRMRMLRTPRTAAPRLAAIAKTATTAEVEELFREVVEDALREIVPDPLGVVAAVAATSSPAGQDAAGGSPPLAGCASVPDEIPAVTTGQPAGDSSIEIPPPTAEVPAEIQTGAIL